MSRRMRGFDKIEEHEQSSKMKVFVEEVDVKHVQLMKEL